MGLFDELGLSVVDAGVRSAARSSSVPHVRRRLVRSWRRADRSRQMVYNGEKFVDASIASCARDAIRDFAEDVCPRCHAPRGLTRASKAEPVARPSVVPVEKGRKFGYIGSAAVGHVRRQRATRRGALTELLDDGFHGYRVDCRNCGTVSERTTDVAVRSSRTAASRPE